MRLWVSILQRHHSGLEPRQIRAPTQVGCALFLIRRRYAGGLRHKHAWSETRSHECERASAHCFLFRQMDIGRTPVIPKVTLPRWRSSDIIQKSVLIQ